MKVSKFLSLIFISLFFIACSEQKDFDSNEWKSWTESEVSPSTRWLMHKDLLKKHQLKGVNTDSILKLLGEPNSRNLNEFNYNLGYSERGVSTGTLILIFKDDKVTEIKVIEG